MTPGPEAPTHLKAQPGDKRSLCGVKDPLPVCTAKAAPMHSYPHPRCRECYTLAGLQAML